MSQKYQKDCQRIKWWIKTYIFVQSLIKIHPHFDEILKKILKKYKKDKILFIKDKKEILVKKLKKRFKKIIEFGYDRIEFLDWMNNDDYINLCGKSSVLLDTLYFGAGNSFHESMVYGTPTITMPGDSLKSRIVLGAYKQMKIEDPPIVENIDDYVEKAVELANFDEKKMIKMKKYLSNNAKKYLYENKNFIREFEKTLLEISNLNK